VIQGDEAWLDLANTIASTDAADAIRQNAGVSPDFALHATLGPVPFVGAISTAPVVLLLSHPELDPASSSSDHEFHRKGWPLSALHPEAPPAPARWLHERAADLITRFGAQQVANAIAAVYLTPWHTACFDPKLRLPSRRLLLQLAANAAARDATLLLLRGADLWTESPAIAALPMTRLVRSRAWRATELTQVNLGDDAWAQICRQIEVHAWL